MKTFFLPVFLDHTVCHPLTFPGNTQYDRLFSTQPLPLPTSPLSLWEVETSYPPDFGLGHVTCFGQWNVSSCNSLLVAFGLTSFAQVVHHVRTHPGDSLLCSLGMGPRPSTQGPDLNSFTPWNQAQSARSQKQSRPAEPSHNWPTCSQQQTHLWDNRCLSLAPGFGVVRPWPMCLFVLLIRIHKSHKQWQPPLQKRRKGEKYNGAKSESPLRRHGGKSLEFFMCQ